MMLTDTTASPYAVMTSMPANSCELTGTGPLALLRSRAIDTTIPSMGTIMFDADIGHAYENFLVAAGDADGLHDGAPFMDGDLYKWLEAAAVVHAETDDPALSTYLKLAGEAISRAQRSDGYLQTKTLIASRSGADAEPYADRLDFENYNLGHLMTMACVHYRTSGDKTLLDVALRAADYLITVAATSPELLADCNICPSHYMGVLEVYRTTQDRRYLDLADQLLTLHGGKGSEGSDDNQDVLPVRDQRHAVGHSVRANYLYAGMADYALESGDADLIAALDSIWNDLTSEKIYLTGGCGALYDGASPDAGQDYGSITRVHQAYGRPYQLPQTAAYNESCASLGLIMWAWRMLLRTGEAKYADEIERVIHNALPAMIGFDAKSYLYTNPLRQVRDLTYTLRRAGDPWTSVVPPSDQRARQEYMKACFCCPPNVARFIAELPYYAYSRSNTDLWVHQFLAGRTSTTLNGVEAVVEQETKFPAEGEVLITVTTKVPVQGTIRVRLPGWADQEMITINGSPIEHVDKGYAVIDGTWHHDQIAINIPLRSRLIVAHHFLEEATNQVAVVRGPVVYCVESADLPDNIALESVFIPASIRWQEEEGTDLFEGHTLLRGSAVRLPTSLPPGRLYGELPRDEPSPLDIRLVPYALWGNRGPGEMSVWMPLLR